MSFDFDFFFFFDILQFRDCKVICIEKPKRNLFGSLIAEKR